MADDELEVMLPTDGFPLLGRQEEVSSSTPTLGTTRYVSLYLNFWFHKKLHLTNVKCTFLLMSGKSAHDLTLL